MNIEELAEELGQLSDTADNYAHAAQLPLPAQTHVERLASGMEGLRDKLRELYVKATGNNPWK